MLQSLANPASPLLQAQSFYCATLIKGSSHMPNYIRPSAQCSVRPNYKVSG